MLRSIRVSFLLILCAAVAAPASWAQTSVFFNEIHYDNESTDSGEAIEIAGPAGTNLSGWSIVLYNGSTGASYDTEALSGLIPDLGGGIGVVAVTYPSNGIQNGAPDGMALVDNGNNVVQFLSYEGSFTAAGGPADGLTSEDIGVAESGGTPVGHSLQLTGTGTTYEEFSWGAEAANTFGAINDGQSFGPGTPRVVINEIDYDQPSTDDAEFIELYNGGSGSADLSTFTLELVNGSNGSVYNTIALPSVVLAPGGFFVICGDAANVDNCDLDVSPNTNLLQNGAPDAIGLLDGGVLVDAVSYEGDVAGYTEGSGAGLVDDDTPELALSRMPDGADTDQNNVDFTARCNTPGEGNTAQSSGCGVAPEPPSLVINEIDYDQPSTDDAEFIELYNTGAGAADLTGVTLELVNGNNGSIYQTIMLPGVSLAAGGYYVVCADASTVIGCDLDAISSIQNGAPDAVGLRDGEGSLLDAVSYEGDTAAPYTEGSGAGLEDSGAPFLSISRFPDGTDTDQNNVDLSARCVSPGAANLMQDTACSDPSAVLQIVINEVDSDTPGTDTAEFVELFGAPNTPLDGLVVVFFNGSSDVSYAAFDLDGFSTDGDGFLLLGNSGVTPTPSLTFGSNGLQNGPDAVALFLGDASDFPNGTAVTTADLLDAIVYGTGDADDAGLLALLNAGQPQVDENGGGDGTGHSSQRLPNGSGGQRNTDTYVQIAPTPGAVNLGAPSIAEIFEIQGAGAASPFAGQNVTTEQNVVTALAPDGFFIQTPDARDDSDPNTSNGIFVFTGGSPAVAVGDVVDVTGEVIEFFDFTEIGSNPAVSVTASGASLPGAVTLDAATPSPDPTAPSCAIEFECYESMLVEISGRVSAPNQRFGTDPLAEVHIVAGPERAFREKGIEFPGEPGLPVWDGNPEIFELDPDRLGLPNQAIPAGSSFDAVGTIGFEFGGYELWPSSLTVDAAPLPNAVRAPLEGELTVGSLNLFRLFDDIDDPPSLAADGRTRDEDANEVVSTAEYERRRDKLAAYILDVLRAPDILAVQEAEKLGVLEDLADDITAIDPLVVYTAYLEEGNDIGTIDVGFLVRDGVQVDAVTQLGKTETFTDPTDNSTDITHDRPPLLLEGTFTAGVGTSPAEIAVMAVHNRSFSGIEGSGGARVRQKRFEQAQSIAQFADDFQNDNPSVGLVVTGDFNDYEFTDGYVDAIGQLTGSVDPAENMLSGPVLIDPPLTNQVLSVPASDRYSYTFQGSAQVLDHSLTSTSLDGAVTGFAYGRGNADAAVDFLNDASTPLRSSDHDGLVLYLDASAPEITLSSDPDDPAVLWPPNHGYHAFSVADFVTSVSDNLSELSLDDLYITSVTSDEVENGDGDGNTTDDIVIADCQTVNLRAERQGGGDGRVYTIHLAVADDAGNVGTASVEVHVPKSKKKDAVAGAAAYEVASGCTAPDLDALAKNAADADAGDTDAAVSVSLEIPSEFALAQNYPNPFNPATTITLALPEAAAVSLNVYDVQGRLVARLIDRSMSAGTHEVAFDASTLPSGIYIYRVLAGEFTETRHMVLMK